MFGRMSFVSLKTILKMVFESLVFTGKLQLKFKNRSAAGKLLGQVLHSRMKRILRSSNGEVQELLVLGIPRGGEPLQHLKPQEKFPRLSI
ncbi:hypothetical protein BH18THE2_BH18THE2_24600 [soil metagenome]